MIDIFESRYPEWKREQVRKELKQLPALFGLIVLGCAVVAGLAMAARSIGA